MLDHEGPQAVHLMSTESVGFREANRFEPKLGDLVTVLNVDMRWLGSFQAVEEEAEAR